MTVSTHSIEAQNSTAVPVVQAPNKNRIERVVSGIAAALFSALTAYAFYVPKSLEFKAICLVGTALFVSLFVAMSRKTYALGGLVSAEAFNNVQKNSAKDKNEIAGLQREVASLQARNNESSNSARTLADQNGELKTSLADAEARVNELETELAEIKNKETAQIGNSVNYRRS